MPRTDLPLQQLRLDGHGPAAEALAQALAALGGPAPGEAHHGAVQHQDRAKDTNSATAVAATPPALLQWLTERGPWDAGPLSLFGPAPEPAQAAPLLAAGLTGWWPSALLAADQAPALAAALAIDRARWQASQAERQQLQRLQAQMDERKWVERAKGVLMEARGISEQEAFGLLRGAAMHTSLRLGEVSRSVTEAAQWAEALNRAGQLRMLSQRLVLLAALGCEPQEAAASRLARQQAWQRVDEILRHLRPLAVNGAATAAWLPLLEQTAQACEALRQAVPDRLRVAALPLIDERAEGLLAAAETLQSALEAASNRRALRIVNLSGRQRMRAQRVAKQALLSQLLADGTRREALPATLDEFEAALKALEQAPLSTPEIRADLGKSRDEWLRLLRGLSELDQPQGRLSVVRASEALLALFDQLTEAYERSLQVIMG